MDDKITIIFEERQQQDINIQEVIKFQNGGVKLSLDKKNGVLSLLNHNDVVLSSVDFPTEKIITNVYYDKEKQELVLEFENSQEVRVPIQTDFNNYYTIEQIDNITNNINKELLLKENKSNLKALAYKDNLTKEEVGLGNVDNTSDNDKPISKATQNAINEINDKITQLQELVNNNEIDIEQKNTLINNSIVEINKDIEGIKKTLTSDDVDYDTLQELVNALKNNTASIGDIFTELSKKANDEDVNIAMAEAVRLIDSKVDKMEGKQLSTNDYTTSEKQKLANLNNYDDTEIKQDIVDLENNKANKNELFSKNYNDLTNKPIIPTNVSQLANDSNFVSQANLELAISNAITKVLNEEV